MAQDRWRISGERYNLSIQISYDGYETAKDLMIRKSSLYICRYLKNTYIPIFFDVLLYSFSFAKEGQYEWRRVALSASFWRSTSASASMQSRDKKRSSDRVIYKRNFLPHCCLFHRPFPFLSLFFFFIVVGLQ